MSSRLAKVIALSLGQGLSSVALIASSIVCNRFLSMADLATYRQTMLAYEFAVPFLTLGIPSSLYYFLSGAKERRRGIIIDNIAISLVMGSIFSVFLLLGGNRLLALRFDNPALETTLRWFIIYPLLTFPVLSLNSVLIICDRITLSAVFQLCTKCLLVAGVIVTCIATRSYEWPLLVKIMVAGISLPAMLYIVFRTVRGGAEKYQTNPDLFRTAGAGLNCRIGIHFPRQGHCLFHVYAGKFCRLLLRSDPTALHRYHHRFDHDSDSGGNDPAVQRGKARKRIGTVSPDSCSDRLVSVSADGILHPVQ